MNNLGSSFSFWDWTWNHRSDKAHEQHALSASEELLQSSIRPSWSRALSWTLNTAGFIRTWCLWLCALWQDVLTACTSGFYNRRGTLHSEPASGKIQASPDVVRCGNISSDVSNLQEIHKLWAQSWRRPSAGKSDHSSRSALFWPLFRVCRFSAEV